MKINRKKQQQQKSKCYNQQITAISEKERAVQFRSSKKQKKKTSAKYVAQQEKK